MKRLILSLVIITILFCSCSKKEDQVILKEKEKQIKLTRYGSENTGFYDYTYNGKQITQEKYSGNNSNFPRVSTFTYQTSGKLKEIHTDFLGKGTNTREEYIFLNEKVVRTNRYNESTNELLRYSLIDYLAGKITSKSFSNKDVLTQKDEYILTSDGKNYVTLNTFTGDKLSHTTNILKFDDKKNPFTLFTAGYFTFSNTSNSLTVEFVFTNPVSSQSSLVTYEYNEMGYPTKQFQNGVLTRIFEYVVE